MNLCSKIFSKKLMAVLISSMVFVSSLNGVNASNRLPKEQFIVLTDENQVYTQEMTKYEAINLQANNPQLIVCEDISVNASSTAHLKEKKSKKIKLSKEEKKDLKDTWNIRAIKADKVKKDLKAEKVKIAIIDSGIDYTDDINLVDYINLIPGEEKLTPMFQDSTGHGTSIAGVIAAKDNDEGITGINENVEIYSAKVLDDKNVGQISRVVEAIYWAIDKKVHIINMSFGTSIDSPALKKAIKDAYNQGILIVSAVGNNGQESNSNVQYPAAYDEVIGVGAVDTTGEITAESAKGEQVELVAPGEQIMSTAAFSGVMATSGTSMAAPHVVGVASLMWQKDLKKSNKFIRRLLAETANLYGDSKSYGNGLIDAQYADKMYHIFEKEYSEDLSSTNLLDENNSDVLEFYGVNFVEGVWESPGHEQLVVAATDLVYVKKGCTLPDNDKIASGMTDNPWWHGYYKNANGQKINYVDCFKYVYQIALKVYNGKYSSIAKSLANTSYPKSIPEQIGRKLKAGIENGVALKGNGASIRQKTYLVFGMALHILADTYAHSTFELNSQNNWVRITHSNKNADTRTYQPERFKAAQYLVNKAVSYFKSKTTADYTNFLAFGYYDKGFKVKNLLIYCEASCINSSFTTDHLPYKGSLAWMGSYNLLKKGDYGSYQ